MNKDMSFIVKLLVAIRESEGQPVFNQALVSEEVLGTTVVNRDNLAIKLQNAGLVEGLITSEDIDNAPRMVFWDASRPCVTLAGIEYMAENKTFHKVAAELSTAGVQAATAILTAAISKYV